MLSTKSSPLESPTARRPRPMRHWTGRFWNGAIQNYWNVIAFYEAKYTYNFWRPVTAIRAAESGINPETMADPNWLPEVGKTAPDPSYPGAHAVISAAGAEVLISFFERDRFEFNVTP